MSGEVEETMSRSFYLASRLRKFAYSNQFGVGDGFLKSKIIELLERCDKIVGSRIRGTLASDVYQMNDRSVEEEDFEPLGELA